MTAARKKKKIIIAAVKQGLTSKFKMNFLETHSALHVKYKKSNN